MRAEVWDADKMAWRDSDREYTAFELTAIQKLYERGYGQPHDRGLTLTLYQDDASGILTTNPAAFERWITSQSTDIRPIEKETQI